MNEMQPNIIKKVLVISPHTDDGELGAGGTIAKFTAAGKEVYYLVFSSCGKSMPQGIHPDVVKDECRRATGTLGILPERLYLLDYEVRTFPERRQEILDDLIKFKDEIKPDLVLTPSSNDTHQDHITVYWETLRAFKKQSSILGYEHPWNNLTFTTDVFVKLTEQHISTKLKALNCYDTQKGKSYFSEEYIRALAISRGLDVEWRYAEAFELVRMVY